MSLIKRLNDIGKEEGGVHDIPSVTENAPEQTAREEPGRTGIVDTALAYAGLAIGLISTLGRRDYGTNDLDQE